MKTQLEGRAFLFGARVSTDDILPGRYLERSNDEVGQFAMAGIDPDFAQVCRPGDLIVAGENFGCGSGRESAPRALKDVGVGAVIAPSFGRVFFRNAVNLGLPALIVDPIEDLAAYDRLRIDLERRELVHVPSRRTFQIRNLMGISLEILKAGGIVPFTRARVAAQRGAENAK